MSMGGTRILVVEDDASIQLGLRMSLERAGYEVALAGDGRTGLEQLRNEHWDLLILDVMLPHLNGYELLSAMAHEGIDVSVLVLSARTDEHDKVRGLDLGAEDYITKPFSIPELLARVRAALRRGRKQASHTRSFGDVTINLRTREVHKGGQPVELTVTEFDLLRALLDANGEALSREQIFAAVWGEGHHGTHRTIDNFVAQLRAKLENNATAPEHLLTVRGVGYRLAL